MAQYFGIELIDVLEMLDDRQAATLIALLHQNDRILPELFTNGHEQLPIALLMTVFQTLPEGDADEIVIEIVLEDEEGEEETEQPSSWLSGGIAH